MKTKIQIPVWLCVIFLILAGCADNSNSDQQATQSRIDTVVIKAMAFHPDTLFINKGDTVVWINKDIVAHDVSRYPDRAWHSDTLQPQSTFVKSFTDSAGYFCSIHPTMRGYIEIKK